MTPKKFLIRLQEIKQEGLIKEGIDIPYFTKEDKEDIESWSDELCDSIFKNIVDNFYSSYDYNDTEMCPWCASMEWTCKKCQYGKRHGICSEKDSDYYAIACEVSDGIVELEYVEEHMRRLIEKVSKCDEHRNVIIRETSKGFVIKERSYK